MSLRKLKWLILAVACIILLVTVLIVYNHINTFNSSVVYISIYDIDKKIPQPKKVNIYIDEVIVGRNVTTKEMPVFSVTPGKHKLLINAAGYKDVINSFKAKGNGEELYFSFTMKKSSGNRK